MRTRWDWLLWSKQILLIVSDHFLFRTTRICSEENSLFLDVWQFNGAAFVAKVFSDHCQLWQKRTKAASGIVHCCLEINQRWLWALETSDSFQLRKPLQVSRKIKPRVRTVNVSLLICTTDVQTGLERPTVVVLAVLQSYQWSCWQFAVPKGKRHGQIWSRRIG